MEIAVHGTLLDYVFHIMVYTVYMQTVERKLAILIKLSKEERRMLEFLASLNQDSLSSTVRLLIRKGHRLAKEV